MLKGMCCKWHLEGVSLGAQNAGRPVNKGSERKQFGLILFGLAYLQHFHPQCQELVPIQHQNVAFTFTPTDTTPPNTSLAILGNNGGFITGAVPGPVTFIRNSATDSLIRLAVADGSRQTI